jgi:hypothetical protein
VGLLDNIEDNLKNGNKMTDPFNVLEVVYIEANRPFMPLLSEIDIDELREKTTLEYIDYENVLNINNYIFLSEESKEKILRLSWLICNIVLYKNELIDKKLTKTTIDLSKILQKTSIENSIVKIYINSSYKYNCKDDIKEDYTKFLIVQDESELEIIVKNTNHIKI